MNIFCRLWQNRWQRIASGTFGEIYYKHDWLCFVSLCSDLVIFYRKQGA